MAAATALLVAASAGLAVPASLAAHSDPIRSSHSEPSREGAGSRSLGRLAGIASTAGAAVTVNLVVPPKLASPLTANASRVGAACPDPGIWHTPAGERLEPGALFGDLAQSQVVLLGERHDRAEHHRWQLHTLAGLHAWRPDLVIGLEMLPREVQPVLDDWVAGRLDAATFVRASDWHKHWGFDPELYLPILHFARLHRIPLLALNLERALARQLANEGWDGVSAEDRHHISPPVEPSTAYRERLREIFEQHPTRERSGWDFERFVAGQLVWDRAMAAGLAQAAKDGALVAGLMGIGHLAFGHGVPHQLRDLGVDSTRVLLPREGGAECKAPEPGLADALFALDEPDRHEPVRLLLGVRLGEGTEGGVEVQGVIEDSVAQAAGLREGDVIVLAAGTEVRQPGDVVTIVRRQAPGTWLPLTVRREGREETLIARFPPAP